MIRRIAFLPTLLMLVTGCSQPAPQPQPQAAPPAAAAPAAPAPAPAAAPAAHGHEHKAPHGGTLVELGEEAAHVEAVVEPDFGKLTLYVLDGECEKPIRIKAAQIEISIDTKDGQPPLATVVVPKVNLLTGETVGDTSEFFMSHERLLKAKAIAGTIPSLEVQGQTYKDLSFTWPPARS